MRKMQELHPVKLALRILQHRRYAYERLTYPLRRSPVQSGKGGIPSEMQKVLLMLLDVALLDMEKILELNSSITV